jgi:hypothetical protein
VQKTRKSDPTTLTNTPLSPLKAFVSVHPQPPGKFCLQTLQIDRLSTGQRATLLNPVSGITDYSVIGRASQGKKVFLCHRGNLLSFQSLRLSGQAGAAEKL